VAQIAVCRIDEVPADTALCKRLPGGQQVAVARLTGSEPPFAVFANLCPHAQGPLGQGRVRNNTIVCPWHFFRFDLITGKAVGTESIMQVRCFPVSVSSDEIRIEL
jgi:nitrite reductase/ring-hydroxylating ferredoxin subunit